MKRLKDILQGIAIVEWKGNNDASIEIKNICFSSQKVRSQDVFVAMKGGSVDGHRFIEDAIRNGASAIVCEALPTLIHPHIVYIKVASSSKAMGEMASTYYGNPSSRMSVVGITGTNGKTTTATLLYQIFKAAGYKVGLISTIRYLIDEVSIPSTHTTPDSLSLHKLIAEMHLQKCAYVFMECSSHAIDQNRIAGISFKGGVFTNLTHDHLDYHGTLSNYRNAKKKFFDSLSPAAFAIINIDDKNGLYMAQNTKARIYSYSLRDGGADYKGQMLSQSLYEGMEMSINQRRFHTPLVGAYNAYNILGAFAAAEKLDMPSEKIAIYLSAATGASGRLEKILHPRKKMIGIVDYAHTPDALQNLLQTIIDVKHPNQPIVTIIGCGGDRDTGKRSAMGKIACMLSNTVIFTSDNPRNEDPEAICKQMGETLTQEEQEKVTTIIDRHRAIDYAVETSPANAIIIAAGKGHEHYQLIKGEKRDFDDKEKFIAAFNRYK